MNFNCEHCNISFKRNCDLTRHILTEKCKNNKIKYKNNHTLIEKLVLFEKELLEYKNRELNYINKIEILENNILNYKNIEKELLTKDTQLNLLQDKYEELRKIIEKAAIRITVKNNYTHNNYLNYISTEPIKFNELKSQVKQIVNCETIMYDDNDFHDHIVDNILKDKSGKDKVLCTDINRKNFTYKDEKSGELISDPELERLRDQLKKGSNVKQLRHELLEKLVNEYEENGSIGIDPYKQFSDIIQKLNFGTPFVEHVAKKTYIKSKSNNIIDKEFDESFDEDEYQKLLAEFGENL